MLGEEKRSREGVMSKNKYVSVNDREDKAGKDKPIISE